VGVEGQSAFKKGPVDDKLSGENMRAEILKKPEENLEDMVEFLQYSFLKDSLLYIGIIAVFGYLVFYFILYNQRNNISELETEIKNLEIRR
jgi:hypothetical protein